MINPLLRYFHRNVAQHRPVILMYHSVQLDNQQPNWPWAVSMRRFRSQIDFLAAEGWVTTTVCDLAAKPNHWKERTVVITFDDGFVDNLDACEELERRGMLATLFIVSGSIGRKPAWPDWPDPGRPDVCLLNGAQLRTLRDAGMEIGSHSVSHTHLTDADDHRLHTELKNSKLTLEENLEDELSSFAYPYGELDERCIAAVQQAGYDAACTTRPGWALRDNDSYSLRRLTVFNTDTVSTLARKLCFGSNDASWGQVWRYTAKRLTARIGSRIKKP